MAKKKECSKCGGDLGHRHKIHRYCNPCHARYMREHRPKHSELTEEQRFKANARSQANVYLKRGKIKKENCRQCGSVASQMHHTNYRKPLDVTWLCRPCHLEEHKKMDQKTFSDK